MDDTFEELVKLIEHYVKPGYFGGPISDSVISAAERILKVNFPKSYRQFIARFAQGSFHGIEINGLDSLSTEDCLMGAVIVENELVRRDDNMPKELLVVNIEDEFYVIIDTSQMKDDEAAVYEIEFGEELSTIGKKPVCDSFGEYYLKRLRGMIEYLKDKKKIK